MSGHSGTRNSPVLSNEWIVKMREGGREQVVPLSLGWEVTGTSMSDNYSPDEITAHELLRLWTAKYGRSFPAIYWHIPSLGENAPFQRHEYMPEEGFLEFFYWPRHARTGERLNFNSLEVEDLNWSWDAHKGGFFQEATGWKPSPLQTRVDLEMLYKAAGINLPIPEEVPGRGLVQG